MTWAALRKGLGLVGLGTAVSLMAPSVRAEGAPSSGAPPATEIVAKERPSTRSFYGWQILATGEAGGVLAAAATVLSDSPMKSVPSAVAFLVGMPFYVLGGPATHWSHGSFEKGLISFGANFVTPIVGGLIGQEVGCANNADEKCGARGFFSGFAVALVTVPIADALILGWEDIPDDDPLPPSTVLPGTKAGAAPSSAYGRPLELRRPRVPQFSLSPAWILGPRGEFEFGVRGRF